MSKEIPKYEFGDDYLVYCAMYILDIKPGTFAHLLLNEKVRGIRTEAEKKRAMTYLMPYRAYQQFLISARARLTIALFSPINGATSAIVPIAAKSTNDIP